MVDNSGPCKGKNRGEEGQEKSFLAESRTRSVLSNSSRCLELFFSGSLCGLQGGFLLILQWAFPLSRQMSLCSRSWLDSFHNPQKSSLPINSWDLCRDEFRETQPPFPLLESTPGSSSAPSTLQSWTPLSLSTLQEDTDLSFHTSNAAYPVTAF